MKAGIIWGSVAGLGLVLVVAGAIVGWVAGPKIVEKMVHEQLDLTDPESDGYEYFVSFVETDKDLKLPLFWQG